jgi:magnesium chelatase subunit I
MQRAATLGELQASGYADRSVKEEMRANLLGKLGRKEPLFPSIVGYGESVLPTLERGIIASHDLIMLGERGQAKSRLIRNLVELLDDWAPTIEGCEIHDHPYRPICTQCRSRVALEGDATPLRWIHREDRFAEKLATPDTSVADLIGDVDPIRVAEGRYLSDELTIHFGLVPRTNRGIFAINELPDLPERIQVALLNILEERDVQIRGYAIRLPLDLVLIASANPEDYTHRGRIITPLKDRFGTQVRTHYPKRIEDEIAIMEQESSPPPDLIPVNVPDFMKEVIALFAARLRVSSQVNQRSGVSVRFSIGALETVRASALRRAVTAGEDEAVPRIVDLYSILPGALGRVEFDTLEEGREQEILDRTLRKAILDVWHRRIGGESFAPLVGEFAKGHTLETSDEMSAADVVAQLDLRRINLERLVSRLDLPEDSPTGAASALEFVLEGLYLTKRLNKEELRTGGFRFEGLLP